MTGLNKLVFIDPTTETKVIWYMIVFALQHLNNGRTDNKTTQNESTKVLNPHRNCMKFQYHTSSFITHNLTNCL